MTKIDTARALPAGILEPFVVYLHKEFLQQCHCRRGKTNMKILGSFLFFAAISATCLFLSVSAQPVCVEYCVHCQDESHCYVCGEGAYPLNAVSTSTSSCKFCIPNCRSCSRTNPPNCDSCDYGFYKTDANGTACQARPLHCQSMSNEMCSRCEDGYGLNAKNECAVCATNCESCLIKGAGKCDRCWEGYTRSSDFSHCNACADNCIACHEAGPDNCNRCKVGYKLQSGKCVKRDCQHGCLCHADDVNRCDTKDVGFMRVLSRDKTKYVVFSCGSNCDRCSVPGSCDSNGCKRGYIYHQYKDSCVFNTASGVHLSVVSSLLALISYIFT